MLRKIIEKFALFFWNPVVDKIYKHISWYALWNHAWKKMQRGIKNRDGVGVPLIASISDWELVTAFETHDKKYHMYMNRFKAKYCIVQQDGIMVHFNEIYNMYNPEYKIQQFCNHFRYYYMIELAATGQVKELNRYINNHWKEIMCSMNDQIERGILTSDDL